MHIAFASSHRPRHRPQPIAAPRAASPPCRHARRRVMSIAATLLLMLVGLVVSGEAQARWVENHPGACSVGPPPSCVEDHWHWETDAATGPGRSLQKVVWREAPDAGSHFVSNDTEYRTVSADGDTGWGLSDVFGWSFQPTGSTESTIGLHVNHLEAASGDGYWVAGPDAGVLVTVVDNDTTVAHLGGDLTTSSFSTSYGTSMVTVGLGAVVDFAWAKNNSRVWGGTAPSMSATSGGQGVSFSQNVDLGGAQVFGDKWAPFASMSFAGLFGPSTSSTAVAGLSRLLSDATSLDAGLRKTFGYDSQQEWRVFFTLGHGY